MHFTEIEQNPSSLRLLCNPVAKNKIDIEFWKFVRDIYFENGGFLQKWPSPKLSESDM
ncbi:MAG: hypothetical protein HOE90_02910 [Bacteriovoracaceae bacterium]|nr:hypothetical protein [Bacteriovoracaceae bacterium]